MKRKRYIGIGIILCLAAGCMAGCGPKGEKGLPPGQEDQTEETDQREEPTDEGEHMDEQKEPQPATEIADFSEEFQSIQGCAVLFDSVRNTYIFYNQEGCETRAAPDSTFKIISALTGLHNQVITGEESKMGYDGTSYPVQAWNGDLSLTEAFQSSCIWYFRKVIDQVGQETVQKELSQLRYGNCDTSEWNGNGTNPLPELNGFWLESSLKISPLEQVEVLRKIMEGKTQYTESEVEILKHIMLINTDDSEKIYGKTGTGTASAWFVGFMEKQDAPTYFAVYLHDETSEEVTGDKAREIALTLLTKTD